MGWPTGLEPVTFGATIRCQTVRFVLRGVLAGLVRQGRLVSPRRMAPTGKSSRSIGHRTDGLLPVLADESSVWLMSTARLSNGPPPWWPARSTWSECRRLLPDHAWLGKPGSHRGASRDETWVVMADVLTRRIGRNNRGPQAYDLLRVERLATSATEVAGALGAGTLLRVSDISGYVDWGCGWPGVGDDIEFEMPGGLTRVTLETHEASADTRDIDGPWSDVVRWGDIMAAAVIVPASHPFARNPTLVAAALGRIEEAAASNARPAASS